MGTGKLVCALVAAAVVGLVGPGLPPTAADGGGGPQPIPTCFAPRPGFTQVAFPVGATPPTLPYPQKHQLTNEYESLGFLFSDADADLPTGYRKYIQTPNTYNVVMQSTLGNLYRVNFPGNGVREVLFVMRDGNTNSTIHRLSAFNASGQRIAHTEYRDWLNPTLTYFPMSVSASTSIKSVVYTQLTYTGSPYFFGNTVTCLDFGAHPPTPTRTRTPTRTVTSTRTDTATRTPTPVPADTSTPGPTGTSTTAPTSTRTLPPTNTPTPTATPGPNCDPASVEANADAWFEQSSTANKGDDSVLKVQSKGPSDAFRAVVSFALPSAPPGCVFDSAELRLYAESAKPGRSIQVQRAGAAWSEMSVNWPNQPPRVGPISSIPSGSEKGWRAWEVTQQVADMYSTGSAYGFVVFDEVETEDSEQVYRSRESGELRPVLIVDFRPE